MLSGICDCFDGPVARSSKKRTVRKISAFFIAYFSSKILVNSRIKLLISLN
jgi:hypothetical protein